VAASVAAAVVMKLNFVMVRFSLVLNVISAPFLMRFQPGGDKQGLAD
jgi:hypothetical protein